VHVLQHCTTGKHSSPLPNPAFPHLQNRRSVEIFIMIFILDLGFFDVPAGGLMAWEVEIFGYFFGGGGISGGYLVLFLFFCFFVF